jgi:hypothetical protein
MPVQEFGRTLVACGLMTQEQVNRTSRFVIDADTQTGLVKLYTVQFGETDKLNDLLPQIKDLVQNA